MVTMPDITVRQKQRTFVEMVASILLVEYIIRFHALMYMMQLTR